MSSIYIELAIGAALAFFTLSLSLLVSAVQEGITRLLGTRAKFLWAYLRDQFDGGRQAEKGQQNDSTADEASPSLLPATALQFIRLGGVDTRPDFEDTLVRSSVERAEMTTANGLYQRLRQIDYPCAETKTKTAEPDWPLVDR